MSSNRWVVLALLFAVRVSTGIQYQAVASLSPQLMSGFVLSIADIGLLSGFTTPPGRYLRFRVAPSAHGLGTNPLCSLDWRSWPSARSPRRPRRHGRFWQERESWPEP